MTAPEAAAEPRHFIDLFKLEPLTLRRILDDSKARKAARAGKPMGWVDADAPARDRTLAMIFEKNSTRTRFSFDAAMRQLGGHTIIVNAMETQLGRGEPLDDTARVLSRMVDAVMIRAVNHDDVKRFSYAASVPVINGLTDRSHPCQVLADMLTFEEHVGPLEGKTIAWIGDGNNVCASFIHAAAAFGFRLNVACPAQYHPDMYDLQRAAERGATVVLTQDPREAVAGADAVVTDTWVSMGDADGEDRLDAFEDFQVDEALMARASNRAIFLHCLPAHRGEEVVDEVIDGPRSRVWDEAENRIHAQKSILAWCLGALA